MYSVPISNGYGIIFKQSMYDEILSCWTLS